MNAVTKESNAGVPKVKLLINGEFVDSITTEWREIINPATQEVLAHVPFATQDEVDAWMDADAPIALQLQRPLPDDALVVVALGQKQDGALEAPPPRLLL